MWREFTVVIANCATSTDQSASGSLHGVVEFFDPGDSAQGRLVHNGFSTCAGDDGHGRRQPQVRQTDVLGRGACCDLLGGAPRRVDSPAALAAVVPHTAYQGIEPAFPASGVFPRLSSQTEMRSTLGRIDDRKR